MLSKSRACAGSTGSTSERPSKRIRDASMSMSPDGGAECVTTSVDPPVPAGRVQRSPPSPSTPSSPSPILSRSSRSSLSSLSSSLHSGPHSSTARKVIEALKDGINHVDDHALLNDIIVPRLALCSASDLVEQVFQTDPLRFRQMSQRARTSVGKARSGKDENAQEELHARFKQVHDRRPAATTAAASTGQSTWMHGVARHAHTGHARRRQFKLGMAVAERPARVQVHNDYASEIGSEPGSSKERQEWTHFLACPDFASSSMHLLWSRVLVACAFGASRTDRPRDTQGGSAPHLVRVVLDLFEHVLAQPTRLFAPGLAVNDDEAHLVVLDHETCRIATIPDCWGQGFGELAAVLAVLLDLDVYSSGYCPVFRYECHPSRGVRAVSLLTSVFGSSVGRTVKFEDEEPIELVSCAKTDGGRPLSERCTTVFHFIRPSLSSLGTASTASHRSPSFVLKMQLVSPSFVGVESGVLRKINDAYDTGALSPDVYDHLATLEARAALSVPVYEPIDEDRLPSSASTACGDGAIELEEAAPSPTAEQARRTLELLILRNPTPLPRPLVRRHREEQDLPLAQVVHVFVRLLSVLTALQDLGFYHRDLSLGNILQYEGHLVLIDWDGGITATPGESVAIGAEEHGHLRVTERSAPRHALEWRNFKRLCGDKIPVYKLAHVSESTVYCFCQVLAHRIEPEDAAWDYFQFRRQRFSMYSDPWWQIMLGRAVLWDRGSYGFVDFTRRDRLLTMIRGEDQELGEVLDQMTRIYPPMQTLSTEETQQTMDAIREGFLQLAARRPTEPMTSQ